MSQSLSRIYLHIIFSTKDRYPYLENREIRAELHAYLGGVAKSIDCQPVIVGGVADHVHVLVCFPRTKTVADVVKELKRASSVWLKGNLSNKFSWQAGYGVFSVSQSNVDQVKRYIRDQEAHHSLVSFQDEYRQFLEKHSVVYDENYIWG